MHRIMVIGGEEGLEYPLRRLRESEDWEIQTVENGFRGIELLESFHPEILLTGVKAPGLEWMEFLRHVKELDPDLEMIVVAGHDEVEDAVDALELGASDFILSPVTDKALGVALHRSMERIWMRHRLQDAIEEIRKRHDFEHKLIQTSMDGIIANDRKGRLVVFNEGATRIYGYSREEALSEIHVTRLYPEGEARRIKKEIYGQDYGGPGRLINYQTLALTREQQLTPILLSATLIHEGSTEVATVGYFKDLTFAAHFLPGK
jgi:two-component system NtrC family sensor kinase